jgi:thioredoxin 1
MPIQELANEEDLEQLVDQHDTVVIDFCAEWCAPCKRFLPILQEVSDRHTDIVFCRVDTDQNHELAQAFEVKAIPTLVVLRDRIMIASESGMLPEEVLENLIGQVKALDMDEVRRRIADREAKEKGSES